MGRRCKKLIVNKGNEFNETLFVYDENDLVSETEYKILAFYIAKINPLNIASKKVSFSPEEYCDALGIKYLNTKTFKKSLDALYKRHVIIEDETDGTLYGTALFNYVSWNPNIPNSRIEMEIADKLIPKLFNLRGYFPYSFDIIRSLNTLYSIRIYELCKQVLGLSKKRTIDVEQLRKHLFIPKSKYRNELGKTKMDNFKNKVLGPAIRRINEYSDITVSYEKGEGTFGSTSWDTVVFSVKDNENYVAQLSFDDIQHNDMVEDPQFAKILQEKVFKNAFSFTQCRNVEKIYLKQYKDYPYEKIYPSAYLYTLSLYDSIIKRIENGIIILDDEQPYEQSKFLYSYYVSALQNNLKQYPDPTKLPIGVK
ncbi:MAG: replication initiation protein [Ruminococcus sp.]|nr:replication initiation protein [Ruminococcus sp.]